MSISLLRSLRQTKALSQAELAAATGTWQPLISLLERGGTIAPTKANRELKQRLAGALGVPATALFPDLEGGGK